VTDDWLDSKSFWHNRRVMVTGGNGFLGKNIVRKLHERGADVFVVDIDRYDLRKLDDIRRALSDSKPQTHGMTVVKFSTATFPPGQVWSFTLPRASAASARTSNIPPSSFTTI
jgi:nucleoside-diphosphate-sugar epimerase